MIGHEAIVVRVIIVRGARGDLKRSDPTLRISRFSQAAQLSRNRKRKGSMVLNRDYRLYVSIDYFSKRGLEERRPATARINIKRDQFEDYLITF